MLPVSCGSPPHGLACESKPLARLDVAFHDDLPTIPARINGQQVSLVLDLGAETSALADTTADRLQVTRDPSALPTITGVGGSAVRWAAVPDTLALGDLVLHDKRMEVAPIPLGSARDPIDGILGIDLLGKYDLDWDLPNHLVTLNAASGCDTPPPGWATDALELPLTHPARSQTTSRLVQIPVSVDDRQLLALLDTGAAISLISPAAASAAEPSGASADRQVRLSGVGMASASGRVHRFGRVTVAGDTLTGWAMIIGPVPLWAGSMIVGEDIIQARRFWLPAGGSRLWFAAPSAQVAAGP